MRTIRLLLVHALLPCALLPQAFAQGNLPDAAAVQRYAEQVLDAHRVDAKGPGLTLLVARDQALLANTARGMASLELGVPLKPEHVMRLGSITKQFAAATLLKLVDEGHARLDDPLSKYLPDFPGGAQITLTQLLNHSSGVKSYTAIDGYMGNPVRRDLSTQDLVAEFKGQPPDFKPGGEFRYSNSGYVLVGAVIEAITGQPWHEALQQRLLAPAQVAVTYPAPKRLVPGHVNGYTRTEQGAGPAGLISMTQPHAAGALVGTTESLWRWNQALHERGLLKPDSYRQMVTPQGAAQQAQYGFGLMRGQLRGMPLLYHSGGIHGFSSLLIYLPEQRVTVALLRNSDAGGLSLDGMARQLGAFAAGRPYPEVKAVSLPEDQLMVYEGVYARGTATRQLRVQGGRLTSQRAGAEALPLVPLGEDRFAFATGVVQLQFQRGTDGRVNGLVLFPEADEQGGGSEPWARSGALPVKVEVALTPQQQQALLGSYVGGPLDLKVFVDDQGQLRAQAVGQPALTLRASGPRELHVVEVDATLSFAPAEGPVQRATLRQGAAVVELKRR